MKKSRSILLLAVLGLFPVLCHAGEAIPDSLRRGTTYPGYIITLQGDTVRGYILNINLWLNQRMTFLYADPEDRQSRVKYTPKEIRAYQVGPRFYESFHQAFTNSSHADNFLLRKVEGPVKYYVWYFDEDKTKAMVWDKISLTDLAKAFLMEEEELWKDEFALKKGDTQLTAFNLKFLMKFAKNMSEYVSDYPELTRKIAEKREGYKNINIEKIIREYNEWFLQNH
jgi:hypothetical protein